MFIDVSSEFFIEGYGDFQFYPNSDRDEPYVLHFQVEKDSYPAIIWNLSVGCSNDYDYKSVEWGKDFIDPVSRNWYSNDSVSRNWYSNDSVSRNDSSYSDNILTLWNYVRYIVKEQYLDKQLQLALNSVTVAKDNLTSSYVYQAFNLASLNVSSLLKDIKAHTNSKSYYV
jgi:hypothetical protein